MSLASQSTHIATELPSTEGRRIQSLDRAFLFLELLAASGGESTLSELSSRAGVPLPTAHRALRAMAAQGYVRQLHSKRYALGSKLITLGDAASKTLGACADPYLQELVATLGESASLSMLDGEAVSYIASAPSHHAMRLCVEVGQKAPLHCTAEGKVILSTLPLSQVKSLLSHAGMESRTTNTIGDIASLESELALIRDKGFALDDGESELGLRSVAVAVPDAPTPMAVSVSGPEARVRLKDIDGIAARLQDAADKLLSCA